MKADNFYIVNIATKSGSAQGSAFWWCEKLISKFNRFIR